MATKMDMTEKTGMIEQADKTEKAEKTDVGKKKSICKRNNYEERKFGFSKVSWLIKNYCVVPFNGEKLFCSPEFYVRGFHLTKWRMILTRTYLSRKSYAVKFRLERLPCEPYMYNVLVDCCLEHNDHYRENIEYKFNKTFGVHATNYEDLRLFNAGIIPTNDEHLLFEDHSDVFTIKLAILVYFPGMRDTFPPCSNVGIRSLGQDLLDLYEEGTMADLILRFQENELVVHKAVILHRLTNENYQRQIISGAESIPFDDCFMHEHAEKVIRYLYTGNLDYVTVTEPAIAVFRFAELLDVKPVVAYYDPDEVVLNSDTEVEEYYTTWTIEDFCNRDDYYLQSPVMINSLMDTKWCLRIYPNGLRRCGDFVHVSLKYETKTSKDICAKFFLGTPYVLISHTYHRQIIPDGMPIGNDFIRRDHVINNYMSDDSLTICLRLRMSTHKEKNSVNKSKSGYKHLSEQRNYDRFSDNILSIYKNERFADLRFDFKDHNIIICAHEYILDARCNLLLYTLKNRSDMRYFRDISIAAIFKLFIFLYSGRFERDHLALEDTFCLHRTARRFNFPILMQVIAEYFHKHLSEEINISDARAILNFASGEGIQNLEHFALGILQINGQRN